MTSRSTSARAALPPNDLLSCRTLRAAAWPCAAVMKVTSVLRRRQSRLRTREPRSSSGSRVSEPELLELGGVVRGLEQALLGSGEVSLDQQLERLVAVAVRDAHALGDTGRSVDDDPSFDDARPRQGSGLGAGQDVLLVGDAADSASDLQAADAGGLRRAGETGDEHPVG